MSFSGDKAEALRLLEGIEGGRLESSDAYNIAVKIDPLLFYFVIRYLREAHGGNPGLQEAISGRLAELFSARGDLLKMMKAGDADPMREWFDDSFTMREFTNKPEAYIDLIYDKLES